MTFTVERLIASIKDNQMRCVAGFEGLSNPITCFTIVDTPNITRWVRSGAFVASVGYVTNENPRLKTTLVRDLAQKDCACLAVKVNQYYEESREEFIEQGKKYQFPIIEVDYSLRFSDIASHIHQTMFQDKMKAAERSYLLYNQLIQVLLSDTDIEEALYIISIAVSNPVLLIDKDFQLIEFENIANNPVELHSIFPLRRGEPILQPKDIRRILNLLAENHFQSHNYIQNGNSRNSNIVFTPIILNEVSCGYLVIPETVSPLSNEHHVMLNNISTALGMYFIKTKYLPSVQPKTKNDFVHQVLLNDTISKAQIQSFANIYGFNIRSRRICINLHVDSFDTFPFEKRNSISNMIRVCASRFAEHLSLESFFSNYKNHFPIFFFFPATATNAAIRSDVQMLAQNFLELMQEQEFDVTIGISMHSDDITQIPIAFRQAINIISLGANVQPHTLVHNYEDLQIYHMLDSTLTMDELRAFADLVWPLYLQDQENNTNFIETLDVFIRCKFNMTQAAAELFLHRNSLAYRINKIKDILGMSIEQQQDLFRIQLSIFALKLYLSRQEKSVT